jgi:hypothetical protein
MNESEKFGQRIKTKRQIYTNITNKHHATVLEKVVVALQAKRFCLL